MPNYVINKLVITSNSKKVNVCDIVNKYISLDKQEQPYFDFEKVIPMPQNLKIECGSRNRDCVVLFLESCSSESKFFWYSELEKKGYGKTYLFTQQEIELLKEKYKNDNTEELCLVGAKTLTNIVAYGSPNWYDWSVKNWGTKWNSCNSVIEEKKECVGTKPNGEKCYETSVVITFDTAWAPCLEVIEKLAELEPNLNIEYQFAEEQAGWYTGDRYYKDGFLTDSVNYDSFSKESYELYFDLWGYRELYKFNEKIGTYEFIDDYE